MESYGSYYVTYKKRVQQKSSGIVASLVYIKHYKELGKRQSYQQRYTCNKRYNNPLLLQIKEHNLGTNIGATNVGAPTIADDISMLPSTPKDTQVMLNTIVDNAKLYKVNSKNIASKSYISSKNHIHQPNAPTSQWDIGEDKIESCNSTTHLPWDCLSSTNST